MLLLFTIVAIVLLISLLISLLLVAVVLLLLLLFLLQQEGGALAEPWNHLLGSKAKGTVIEFKKKKKKVAFCTLQNIYNAAGGHIHSITETSSFDFFYERLRYTHQL